MPSARKRDARSRTPPAGSSPARAPRDTRRSLLLGGIVAATAAIVIAAWILRRGSAQADLRSIPGQNVLLITIDTLRADALGSYGGQAATPALDRLARDGVRFDFAHAHAVLTLPSHASILTGEYPFRHGLRDNSGYRLPSGARTIATLLTRAGYATGAFVSAFPVHSRFGLNQGFDVYDDRFGETRAPTEFVMPERAASASVPLARDWIAARTKQPNKQSWFAWVHVFDPHAPYHPPAPFDAQYAGRPYDGEVAATDAALSPLIDDVRTADRPTLVIVTGDHGEALGDHGEETHGVFAYESTLRVPLIVAELGGDGRTPSAQRPQRNLTGPGEISPAAARHVDILPTILDAIGQPVPSDLPGRSLLAAAERRAASSSRPSYFESMSAMLNRGWAPLTGIVADREKYIDVPIPERYDVAADGAEQTNLAGKSPERDRTLAAALNAFGAPLPGQRRVEDADALARLRALGYVSGSAPAKTRYTDADDPKRLIALDQAIHRGVALYVARRFGEAVQVYQDVIKQRPDMSIAYRHLAFVAWESGDVGAAVGVLQQALRAGVVHGELTTQLGTYLAESGHADEAVRLLEPVATGAAPDLDALNALGIAYARMGRTNEARRLFLRMLSINAESGMAIENLATLDLERGDFGSAGLRFERAVRLDPGSSQAHAGLGVVAMKRGDRRTAVDAWKKAVELDPTNYDALYNLATTLAGDRESAAARPYLEQFVRAAPPALYAKEIRDVTALLQHINR
jgi:arylsulfatase A-like enzyme/cytochrome c-type biogenesis protein CcmH/NrfG